MSAVQQQVAAGQQVPADVSMDTIQQQLYTKVQLHVTLESSAETLLRQYCPEHCPLPL